MVIKLSYSFGFDAHDSFQDSTLDMMIDYSFGFDAHVFYQDSTLDMMDMMIDSYEKRNFVVIVVVAAAAFD